MMTGTHGLLPTESDADAQPAKLSIWIEGCTVCMRMLLNAWGCFNLSLFVWAVIAWNTYGKSQDPPTDALFQWGQVDAYTNKTVHSVFHSCAGIAKTPAQHCKVFLILRDMQACDKYVDTNCTGGGTWDDEEIVAIEVMQEPVVYYRTPGDIVTPQNTSILFWTDLYFTQSMPTIRVDFSSGEAVTAEAVKLSLQDKQIRGCLTNQTNGSEHHTQPNTNDLLVTKQPFQVKHVQTLAGEWANNDNHYIIGEHDCQTFSTFLVHELTGCRVKTANAEEVRAHANQFCRVAHILFISKWGRAATELLLLGWFFFRCWHCVPFWAEALDKEAGHLPRGSDERGKATLSAGLRNLCKGWTCCEGVCFSIVILMIVLIQATVAFTSFC